MQASCNCLTALTTRHCREMAEPTDAVSSLLSRSLDDIIKDSRSASKKVAAGKAPRSKQPKMKASAEAAPFVKREKTPSNPSSVRITNLAWSGEAFNAYVS